MRTKTPQKTSLSFDLEIYFKSVLCILLFIIFSKEKAQAFVSNTINKKTHYNKANHETPPNLINSIAYVLLWDTSKFLNWYKLNKGNKVIFRFYYSDDSTTKNLTIAGWTPNANDYFDDDPSINNPDSTPDLEILKNQSTDNLDLSENKYFFLGNIKISEWTLDRIKKGLKNQKYLLLKPVLDSDNHVVYEIYLQNENPHSSFEPADKTVSKSANLVGRTDPSPPATSK